jgi:hypothetical protein
MIKLSGSLSIVLNNEYGTCEIFEWGYLILSGIKRLRAFWGMIGIYLETQQL